MTRFREVGQLVRVRYLALLMCCSCAHKTTALKETEKRTWETATNVAKTEAVAAEKKTSKSTSTRRVTRKPDGTVIDEVVMEGVVDLLTFRYGGNSTVSLSDAGSAEKDKNLKQESKPAPVGWWVRLRFWLLLVVVVALLGGAGAVWRRVTKLRKLASGLRG